MKKLILILGCTLLITPVFSQADIANPVFGHQRTPGRYVGWSPIPNGSIAGPLEIRNDFNEPISLHTNNIQRAHLNEDRTPTINGFAVNTDGFMGLGPNNLNIWTDPALTGPFSLLHLNGKDNTLIHIFGYRPWMKTGISFTDNNDLSYIGLRAVGNGSDVTETVISWSDNPGTGQGPDEMAFRFTRGGNGNNTINTTNLTTPNDLDGLHIARFTALGNMGLGPTFGADDPIYVSPQSLQHLSRNNLASVFTQYTNRLTTVGSGTAETVDDGLRVGILGHAQPNRNGNALIYNQERKHLLLSTDRTTALANFNTGDTGERVRITSTRTETNLATGGYGVFNPSGITGNVTRVSISHNPNIPVTRPLSLLHLGFNTGAVGGGTTDGWRDWMDIGTFTSNGTDNMYVGLKNENTPANPAFPAGDKHDAVINWGDNGGTNPANGPDNLRFIFTETQTSTIPGNAPATSNNGLEVARFDPQLASTLTAPNFGMMGIGDFTTPANVATPIDAKLDIDGDLRIREVTQNDTLYKVLVIDEPDHNRVHWRDISTFGGLGNLCSSATAPLTGNAEIDLGGNNLYIHNPVGNVNIGDVICGSPDLARLFVRNTLGVSPVTVGIWSECGSTGTAGVFNGAGTGIQVQGTGTIGPATVGVASTANGGAPFVAGVAGEAIGSPVANSGVAGVARFFTPGINVGVRGRAINGAMNYGVFGSVVGTGPNNFAGFFNGQILCTPGTFCPSDVNIKTNIQPLIDATTIIGQLAPKTFNFDTASFPSIVLPGEEQMGLIAQDVASILPNLVSEATIPAVLDSNGNVITPAVTVKTLRYEGFIPLLIAGMKEQQEGLTAKDSLIDNLEDRLAALEQCLNENNLCNGHARVDPGNGDDEGKIVQLENLNAIILDQNLPNPFKEKTTINYSIPEEVMEAQLLFYDMNGRIIKQVEIAERGEGKLTVYGENLQNGIYTYSLIADGKLISTKRMVKSK